MSRRRWTVGVDFGGTNIRLGLVDRAARLVSARVLDSRPLGEPARFLPGIVKAIGELSASVGVSTARLVGVGVGAPGPVDVARGMVHTMVNVPGWHRVSLAARLERWLGCPCAVDNDANLFALGEWRFGAARGARHVVGLTLGTGVGGGLILNGAVYRGSAGAAGELGHQVVDPRGPRCSCGARGCLEALVGAAAIVRTARRVMRSRATRLRRMEAEVGDLTPRLIGRAARAGDRTARIIWQQVGWQLGRGMATIVNMLNPDCIVIGGGIANNWSSFAPAMRESLRLHAMRVASESVRVVRSRLGRSAGVLGAAMLVWSELQGRARR